MFTVIKVKDIVPLILAYSLFAVGCDSESDDIKKDKLIFLYKLRTNVSLLVEETTHFTKQELATIHKNKLVKYLKDSENITVMPEWNTSLELIYEYRNILYENIETTKEIENGTLRFGNSGDREVENMRNRLNDFNEKLKFVISETDRE